MIRLLLEESLSHTLVDDDECDVGEGTALSFRVVLVCEDFLQLIKLEVNDLLAHGVAHTVTIDEDMVRESSAVELAVSLEGASEVLLEDVGRYDLLALLRLGARLCVVFTHILVVCGHETNDALLSLVANIDTHKHGFV